MPSSKTASSAMMMVSVILAFFARIVAEGHHAIAHCSSTPVIAVQPDEKTLSMSHRPSASRSRQASLGAGALPAAHARTGP